ncbi:HAMP domain-containing protein, partial [Eisenbergiella porci]
MKGINMGENGKKSIFKKVLWSMGAVMTGAILIIEISSLLLIHKDGQRAQELFEDTIDSYGVFWENKLNETSRMMLSFISAETGALYSQLCNSEDKLTVETAKLQLRSQIADMNARQGYELVTFVYVPDRNIYFSVDEKNTSYLKSQGIKENVFDYIAHNTIASKDKWSVLYVQDTPYLLKIYHMENGYIGSLYPAGHILEGLYDQEENWVLEMVDRAGNTVAHMGEPYKGMTVSYDRFLEYTDAGIRVTIGSGRLYSNKGTGVLILMGAMLFASLLIFLVLGRQTRDVFEPLERLRAAMENYSGGDMDTRLPVVHDNSQIANLFRTFNNMADQ